MDDERLIDVVNEIKRLRAEISEKQWQDQETTLEDRQLRHFEKLAKEGDLYEPRF